MYIFMLNFLLNEKCYNVINNDYKKGMMTLYLF